jgi:uracil-DNA glycosylase
MLKELQEYYDSKKISAMKFDCPHYPDCSAGHEKFTKATEAFVSSGYENHTLPRLLFISLDSGSGVEKAKYRTLADVRDQEEVKRVIEDLAEKNKNWYRTHEMARMILRNFNPQLRLEQAKHYFAHTYSAKCCPNKEDHGKADKKMFRNCKEFVPGEVLVLAPDIIITQGEEAEESIAGVFKELDPANYLAMPTVPPEVKVIEIEGAPVLWIHTFHPRSVKGFNQQKAEMFGTYTKATREFIEKSKRWRG